MHGVTEARGIPAGQSGASLGVLLDQAERLLLTGDAVAAVNRLCNGLRDLRAEVAPEMWSGVVRPACRSHAVWALLNEDPHTARAFEKPRGYAGDAVLLDFLYDRIPPPGTSAFGARVFAATTGASEALGVVFRRDRLAALIDEVSDAVDRPRILSVACGHLREGQRSRAAREGRFKAFFALDQDAESLALVEREQSSRGVTAVHASVRDLLRGRVAFAQLDLAYAAGLFDYLADPVAARLAALMLGMLRPGGRLLLANFAPDCYGSGYRDAIMDWSLIYRDEAALCGLLQGLPPGTVASARTYRDPHGNIAFLEATRGDGMTGAR
jgi:SAM-dependent methyltransferase